MIKIYGKIGIERLSGRTLNGRKWLFEVCSDGFCGHFCFWDLAIWPLLFVQRGKNSQKIHNYLATFGHLATFCPLSKLDLATQKR
jgi:hypothetical protein